MNVGLLHCRRFRHGRINCPGNAVVQRRRDGSPELSRAFSRARLEESDAVAQLIMQGSRKRVRPGLDYLSEVDPNLIIRGEREARRVKLRDAVMDRDQRVGSFRKLAIEVREALAQLLHELTRLLCPRLIHCSRLGRLRSSKTLTGLHNCAVDLAKLLIARNGPPGDFAESVDRPQFMQSVCLISDLRPCGIVGGSRSGKIPALDIKVGKHLLGSSNGIGRLLRLAAWCRLFGGGGHIFKSSVRHGQVRLWPFEEPWWI